MMRCFLVCAECVWCMCSIEQHDLHQRRLMLEYNHDVVTFTEASCPFLADSPPHLSDSAFPGMPDSQTCSDTYIWTGSSLPKKPSTVSQPCSFDKCGQSPLAYCLSSSSPIHTIQHAAAALTAEICPPHSNAPHSRVEGKIAAQEPREACVASKAKERP